MVINDNIYTAYGGLEHDWIIFHIWDVIPTPLTKTPSFFKMVIATPTS